MRPRLLVTGFEPFGGKSANPSEALVRRLAADPPKGAIVSTRVLPVAYRRAFAPLAEALDTERFDAALLLGLRAGASQLEFERFGVNWRGAAGADNDGVRIDGEAIDPAGPAAYFATCGVAELVTACRAAGAPAGVSSHAGTFLCNQVLYQTLRRCDMRDLAVRAGFLHVPLFPEMAAEGEASVAADVVYAAVRAALDALAASA